MSALDAKRVLIIEALRHYKKEFNGEVAAQLSKICKELKSGDLILTDCVLKDFHLVYSYKNKDNEVFADLDFGCQAENVEHAVDQLIDSLRAELNDDVSLFNVYSENKLVTLPEPTPF